MRLQHLIRDERGSSVVGWTAMSVLTFFLIVGLWTALYGGPGRALKAEVGTQVSRFANGFEGGLGGSGPTSGVPAVGQGQKLQPQSLPAAPQLDPPSLPGTTLDVQKLPPPPELPGTTFTPRELPPAPVLQLPTPNWLVFGMAIGAGVIAGSTLVLANRQKITQVASRVFINNRGSNPVEYTAVTGIALVLAAMIILGVTNNRIAIGSNMGGVLNHLIQSYDSPASGTISDRNLWLPIGEPHVGSPLLPIDGATQQPGMFDDCSSQACQVLNNR